MSEAKDVFNNQLSDNESVWFAAGEYLLDQRLETNASGITIDGAGPHGVTLKTADGANVGAIGIGLTASSTLKGVTVKNIGIDGNRPNQEDISSALHLHGLTFDNCEDVNVENVYIQRTSPQHHNTGGSGISFHHNCKHVEVTNSHIHDPGDRGIQTAANRTIIQGCSFTEGFDRSVSLGLTEPDGNIYKGDYLSVSQCIGGENSNGSFIGVEGRDDQVATGLTVVNCTAVNPKRAIAKGHAKYAKIIGNTGINAQITQVKGDYVKVKDNTAENAPKDAISIAGADYADIEGNTVNGAEERGCAVR